MTLRHLRIFLRVCEEKTMTKAAVGLHMTQPAVSLAIRELEAHYNTLLFERLGHSLHLTEAGQRLLIYARHIISLDQQAESAMQSFSKTDRLRIGASVTIGESVLIDLLQHLYKLNPVQDIFSEIHNTAELESRLLKNELDLALIEGEVHSEYLIIQPFIQDELVFVVSPGSTILQKEQITLSDLPSLRFFVREAGSGTRDLFEKVMHQHGVKIHIAGIYNNSETIKKAVAADLGASVISRRAVYSELARGELASFKINDISFKRYFNIVFHKNKYMSPALKKMIALCHGFANLPLE